MVPFGWQGDASNPEGTITKQDVVSELLAAFELEIDPDVIGKNEALTKADLEAFLTEKPIQ